MGGIERRRERGRERERKRERERERERVADGGMARRGGKEYVWYV